MTDCPLSGRSQGDVNNFYILDLENFATPSHRCIHVINQLVDVSLWITPTTVKRVIAECRRVYYTLVDCNPLTPLLRLVLDLSYTLFLHCYAAVNKI